MKKILVATLLSTSVMAPALADSGPFYAGGSIGSSSIGSYSSTAVGAFAGYRLDQVKLGGASTFAVEGQYTSLGSIPYSNSFSSLGVDAVAMLPLASMPNLSVFGKLGVNSINGHFSCGPFCSYSASSNLVIDFGLGGQYKLTRDFSVRVGYQYYDTNFSNIYAAAVFHF